MRYLVVGPDGQCIGGTGNLDMASLQALVGGDFEVMPSPLDIRVTVLAPANAKREGRPANHAATRLLAGRLRPDDFVAGVVVVTGPIDAAGALTDLTDEAAAAVTERVAV